MGKKYIDQEALLADMESRLRSLERNECPDGAEDFAAGVRRGFRMGMNYVGSAEGVEVVRCRKCVHWGQGYHHKTPTRMGLCARFTRWTPDKFYCGEGKRREDGDA